MNEYSEGKGRWTDKRTDKIKWEREEIAQVEGKDPLIKLKQKENALDGEKADFIDRMFEIHNFQSRKANEKERDEDGNETSKDKKYCNLYTKEKPDRPGVSLRDFFATIAPWQKQFTDLKDADGE